MCRHLVSFVQPLAFRHINHPCEIEAVICATVANAWHVQKLQCCYNCENMSCFCRMKSLSMEWKEGCFDLLCCDTATSRYSKQFLVLLSGEAKEFSIENHNMHRSTCKRKYSNMMARSREKCNYQNKSVRMTAFIFRAVTLRQVLRYNVWCWWRRLHYSICYPEHSTNENANLT